MADDAKFLIILADLVAYGQAADSADTAHESATAANQAAFSAAASAADVTLQAALAANQTAFSSAMSAAQLALSTALASAQSAYDAVATNSASTPSQISSALGTYEAATAGAYGADLISQALAMQTQADNDAIAQDVYIHANDAAKATQQTNDALADYSWALAVNAAQKAQTLGDTAAETAYQIQLDSFAEIQSLADAAASLAFSLSINTALATQSTSDAVAANTFSHAINPLLKDYALAMGDADAANMTAVSNAGTQQQVAIDNAAASAWSNWASSTTDPYDIYQAATQAASYIYDAAITAINGSSLATYLAAENQWSHDVSGGWLTYQNDRADHAQAFANSQTTAATLLTNAFAANLNTFATTVAPAIQTQADAENNNANTAIQAVASAAETYANAIAANVLAAKNAMSAALQAVNDALGDVAKQQVQNDSAALVVLATVEAGDIGQLVEPAPPPSATSKSAFDENLRRLVHQAGLFGEAAHVDLYTNDHGGEIGFDCDDFADALQRYLVNKFAKDSGAKVSIITITWREIFTEYNHNHALLLVERYGQYWFVNPTRGHVRGPFADMNFLKVGIIGYLPTVYTTADPATIEITGTYTDHAAFQKATGEPPAWYKSEQMRKKFLDYLKGKNIDPKPFFPPGYYQPTIPDNSIYIFGF